MFAATAPAVVEEIARSLGSRIRLARMRRRVPLRDLAERAGVNHKTASAVESGIWRSPSGGSIATPTAKIS
jgi:transcriptional regulator with XRE-family HTH domain